MREDSRDANSVSAVDPTSSTASTMLNSRSNARLRSARIALVVSSTSTAPRTSSPTQIGCAAVTITARPSGVVRRSTVRMPASAPVDLARVDQRAPGRLARRSPRSAAAGRAGRAGGAARARAGARRRTGRGLGRRRAAQRARAREHVEVAIDHPDARRRAREPAQDLRDLGRRGAGCAARRRDTRLGAIGRDRGRREQPRPIVQRGGDRLRGAGERALLRVAQHALELAHVLVAQPRHARNTVSTSSSWARIDSAGRTGFTTPRRPSGSPCRRRSRCGRTPDRRAWNLRRMRLTCEVIVLSSTTMLRVAHQRVAVLDVAGKARERVHHPELGQREVDALAVPVRGQPLHVERERAAARPRPRPAARARRRDRRAGTAPRCARARCGRLTSLVR